MEIVLGLPVLRFATERAWEDWLAEHHAQQAGVWLMHAKKGAREGTVSYAQALDVALCYGWIDGQKRSYDNDAWLQRFTPRRPRSPWSKINTEKVAVLIAAGRMRPAGLKEVERARSDGRWDAAYSSQSTIAVPDDLRAELDGDPDAAAFFATLSKANRYAMLYRIESAMRPETRRSRLETCMAMLREHKTFHQLEQSGRASTPAPGTAREGEA